MPHRLAGVAEDNGRGGFYEAQQIHHRRLAFLRVDANGAIFNIDMALLATLNLDAHGIALIAARQHRDALGDGGGKQQAAFFRRHRSQHEFEILAKTEIEHLVGFIEHHDRQRRNIQRPALNVVAQTPGRANDDMDARLQGAALALRVHAADAGANARAGVAIEPGQLAFDLQRQLPRRRNDEGERRAGRRQSGSVAEQRLGHRDGVRSSLGASALLRRERRLL